MENAKKLDQMKMEPAKSAEAEKAKTKNAPQSNQQGFTAARSGGSSDVGSARKRLVALFMKLKKLEATNSPTPQALLDEAKELAQDLQSSQSEFHGIISRCWISGNDCHLLDSQLAIIGHFDPSQKIPDEFSRVRGYVRTLPINVIAVFVYADGSEYLHSDGSTSTAEF